MSSRYDDKVPFRNRSEKYEKTFEDRGVKFIKHYSTPEMSHPTVEDIESLDEEYHTWKLGDRFYKLAAKHYGNETYWWVIAWYNKTPTESHVDPGQILAIPFPLDGALNILRMK